MDTVIVESRLQAVRFDDSTGLLAESDAPYQLTIEEMHKVFVLEAPFSDERKFLFSMFVNYLKQVQDIAPDKRVWVDGSFVSLRNDRAPSDVDVLMLVNNPSKAQRIQLFKRGLLTMSDVTFTIGENRSPSISKMSPYGGLVDAYFADGGSRREIEHWEMLWSTPKREDGQLDFERSKGFVEVITNDNL